MCTYNVFMVDQKLIMVFPEHLQNLRTWSPYDEKKVPGKLKTIPGSTCSDFL